MPDDPHDPMKWWYAESAQRDPDDKREGIGAIVWGLVGFVLLVGLIWAL